MRGRARALPQGLPQGLIRRSHVFAGSWLPATAQAFISRRSPVRVRKPLTQGMAELAPFPAFVFVERCLHTVVQGRQRAAGSCSPVHVDSPKLPHSRLEPADFANR